MTDLDVGGAESMLARVLAGSEAMHGGAAVISLTSAGVVAHAIRRLGVQVFALGVRSPSGGSLALGRLLFLVRRLRPQIIQTWLYHADLAGILVGKMLRVPTVWNIRCAELDPRDHPRSLKPVRWVLTSMSRAPAAIVVNSEAGRRAHEALGYRPRRWVFIPNGFDTAVFRPDPSARVGLRTELGLPIDAPLVGLLARRHPMKDHETFLRAACELGRERQDLHFVAAGRGVSEDRRLRAMADEGLRSRVHLLPERVDAAAFLAALDVCVSASYSEAFPNVVGEAMACGVPCVATDVGETANIVGDAGVLIPPRRPDALAHGILRLLSLEPAERATLSARARARIESKYSLSMAVAKYDDLYRQLSAPPRQDGN